MLKKIKFNDMQKIDILTTTNMTDNDIIKKYNPTYLINLALYDMSSGQNITWLEDENKKLGYLFSNRGLGITKDNQIIWCDKTKAYQDDNIRDYCSFSPILVENNKVNIDWGNKVSSYVNGDHYRSFLGINNDYLFIGVSDTTMTINELADYCLKQGMTFAGNNDGNGSMSLWEKGKPLKDSVRKNATWLLIWIKEPPKPVTVTPIDQPIIINNKEVIFESFSVNGKTYIEMRKLTEALNKNVIYNTVTKKITIQ